MATYAIGDVQGCYDALKRLLDLVRFDSARDRLWFAGDLVNRGPNSLPVLRLVRQLGDAAVTVLGNHDIHLLCRAACVSGAKKGDTLGDVLRAPDAADLLSWLRTRPLIHREDAFTLVHAGVLPQWSLAEAQVVAGDVAQTLQSEEGVNFLRYHVSHNLALSPDDGGRFSHLSFGLNVLTRLRICTPGGEMEFSYSGPLEGIPEGFRPWFAFPIKDSGNTVLFGHWAALGLHKAPHAICLDSGCVWGGSLSALRLDDGEVFQVPSTAPEE